MNLSKHNGLAGKVDYSNNSKRVKASKQLTADKMELYNSARWKRLRNMTLRESPLCVRCALSDEVVAAEVVDHVLIFFDKHDTLATDSTNLRSLCAKCHNTVTQIEKAMARKWLKRYEKGEEIDSIMLEKYSSDMLTCDEDGYPL